MTPVLYSFRRCPYAMRARLALLSSKTAVVLREVVLREKPQQFLDISPSATVPCLFDQGTVIDESLDIMKWALTQNDPDRLLGMPDIGWSLIDQTDGPFKHALDRTKYATRFPEQNTQEQRAIAAAFLTTLDQQIDRCIFERPSIADLAILPFVRQFAFIDKAWFDDQPWPKLHTWLNNFLTSDDFDQIMQKYQQWHEGDPETLFPVITEAK